MAEEPDHGAGAGSFSAHSSRDKAFEIFVKRTITSIQKEAWGRSKEVKEIREACQAFLNSLDQIGCTGETLKQVLYPLQLACASNMQKVVELALGCLHKLVAHAWLHGESTAAGTMDILSAHGSLDDDDTVANVIKMVIKCGEATNEALQLAVVRALLTFTTAEHFIAHGECLLSAVRAVFNLALGAENPINKRTASNALLQMLNTICKRVTQIQPRLTGGSSECSSRTVSEALELYYSVNAAGFHGHNSPHSAKGSGTALDHLVNTTQGGGSAHGPLQHQLSDGVVSAGGVVYDPDAPSTAAAAGDTGVPSSSDASNGGRVSSSSTASAAAHARAAQLAQLAENKDLQGLEAALEAAAAAQDADDGEEEEETAELRTSATAAAVSAGLQSLQHSTSSGGGAGSMGGAAAADATSAAAAAGANGAAAGQLPAGAAAAAAGQVSLPSQSSAGQGGVGLYSQPSWQQQQQQQQLHGRMSGASPYVGRGGRQSHRLTTQEKDVLLVLTAFCKLASREVPGATASSDSVLAQGKLLALEMLAKVLSNPMHNWDHVPEAFCRQLRQPLCMALLRNCATPDSAAYGLALKLLMAILNLPRIRLGLRAELGAFYPLLVLRHLEQQQAYLASAAAGTAAAAQQQPPDPANVAAALSALQSMLTDPQLLVDLFVNFDCDLQAANLFERTVQVLAGLAALSDRDLEAGGSDKRSHEAAAGYAAVRKHALSCSLQVIAALESWAKPIKDAALRAIEGNQATSASQGGSGLAFLQRDSASSLTPGAAAGASPQSEAERLAAAKSTKELLAKGISLFNTKGPLKGIKSLVSNGLLESSPAAVTTFLRTNQDSLDKAQLGELLGHQEDFAIAVMHAWIDSEPSMAGQAIDQSLRKLLAGFRLPGEAQKIDRIMEKFAERFCKDNPSRFHNADSAYMLSFSIIMLNTDAHNPLAERRLTKADFVTMNHTTSSDEGVMLPVLPVQQLEEIYDRVVREEILVLGESRNSNFSTSRTTNRNRLAAAMGWTTVLQPFRALAGGNNKAGFGKDSSAHAHRRYLQELAEREVVRAAASGNMWYCASHPEHVRPMLQVGFPVLLQALSAAFVSAPDAATAARLLSGLLQLTKLCGLLGLDRQCEAAVGVLAARCGVFDPAPPGTLSEAKQLSALQALLTLTSGPEAGFLGSSWVIILRVISALDALKQELTRPPPAPAAPAQKEAASTTSNPFSRMFQSMFGSSGSNSAGGKDPWSPNEASAGGTKAANAATDGSNAAAAGGSAQGGQQGGLMRDSLDGGGSKTALAIRDAPGAGLVMWAESAAGSMELERPYAHSTSLDGDAIVVFMRALCAVSQEELEAGSSSVASAASSNTGADGRAGLSSNAAGGPRLFSLQKVVECAYHNMDRIRLVWAKLWAVIAAQLVGASCHPHRRVALYAVDSLRQLVAKLLARAELEHFTHQEEALRPFVAVLRQCDEACVRELAVQCIMQAVTTHPSGLGSGWRMVILALRLGAADGSPSVMAQTQEALQVVVDTLFASPAAAPHSTVHSSSSSSGHTFLRETVQAIVAGIRNPAHLELSISAVQLLGGCGVRLAAYEDVGGKEEAPSSAVAAAPGGVDLDGDYGWGLLLRTLADVLQHDRRPAVVDASLEMAFGLLSRYSQRWDAAAWRVFITRVVRHMLALPAGLSPPAPQAALDSLSGSISQGSGLRQNPEGTSRLAVGSGTAFGSPVGSAAGAGAVSSAGGSGSGAGGVLQFAGSLGGGAGGAVPVGMSVSEQGALMTTLLQRMDRYYPLLCDQAAVIRAEYKADMVQQLVIIGVSWYQQNSVYLSTAGIKALMRLAHTLAAGSSNGSGLGSSWQLFAASITAAVQADVQQILALAHKQLAESASAAGAAGDAVTSGAGGGSGGKAGTGAGYYRSGAGDSSPPNAAKGGMVARKAAAVAAAAAAVSAHLRVRTRQLVLLQRGLASIHRDCRDSMSWDEQVQLLDALALGVEAAIAFNTDISIAQQQRQQQWLAAGSPRRQQQPASAGAGQPQLEQQQQQQQQAVQGPGLTPGNISTGSDIATPATLHESISLASAVAPEAGATAAGLDASLLPFGSSIRVSELSLSGYKSSGGGSTPGSTAGGSTVGSLAGGLGGLQGVSEGTADPFFQMRSSNSTTNSGGGGGGAGAAAGGSLLLSRSASAGSTDVRSLPGSHGGAAAGSSSSNGGPAAGAGAAAAAGESQPDGAASTAAGPAVVVPAPAPLTAQQQRQQPELEITPLSPPGSHQQQQQQGPPSPQPPRQVSPDRPNLPPVRTSTSGQPEGNTNPTHVGGGFSSNSPSSSSSPGRQRWSGGGREGSPGRTRIGGLVLPQLMVSSPESIDVVQPAFMRLEAEGGLLLIEALTLCVQSAAPASEATQATQLRLLQLVRCVIESEAASSSIVETPPSSGLATPSGALQSPTLGPAGSARGSAADNPLQDALAGVGWEHAARAPLVVAALQVLSELQGAQYHSEVLQLFPALCRLMSSNHQLIRAALAKVFSSRNFLGLLPVAAGAVAAVGPGLDAAAVGGVGAQQQQQWQQVVL